MSLGRCVHYGLPFTQWDPEKTKQHTADKLTRRRETIWEGHWMAGDRQLDQEECNVVDIGNLVTWNHGLPTVDGYTRW